MSHDVVTLGETMALFTSDEPGTARSGSRFTLGVGGSEANVAIGLARLGTPSAWIGRVGADPFGDEVVRVLRGEGVTPLVVRDASRPTGVMAKVRRTPLHQRVVYLRTGSAGSALGPDDVDARAGEVAAARVLHLSGITPALSASAAGAVDRAVALARAAGVLVSLDVNYRSALWSRADAAERLGALLEGVDLLFAGTDEALLLDGDGAGGRGGAGVDDLADLADVAERLSARGPREVVLTHGASGATAVVDGRASAARPPAVPVVDTVGAGDAFVAGYLSALIDGAPVAQRLVTGCRTGAFACMSPGDWEGAPTRAELALLDAAEPVTR